jgi:cell division protein FtsI/penicillin-binding protein 2
MRIRFYILMGLFGLIAITWSVYLFSIQMFDPLDLGYYIDVRYKPGKEILIPTRGSVFDSGGDLLVSSVAFYQVDIDRKQCSNWAKKHKMPLDTVYNKIASVFAANSAITKDVALEKLQYRNSLSSIQISNKIKESELEKLLNAFEKQKLPGFIHSFSSMRRIYSQGITAARVLGSVKENTTEYDPGDPVNSIYRLSGLNGLEATYDRELAGQYGWREVVYDANHNRVPYPNLHEKKQVNGYNLWLTIESDIQDAVEEALAEGLQLYGAKNAAAVVMDPNTGRILAMAGVSAEDYSEDPGFVRVKSNIPVSFMFEPGSTMKPFTALAALQHKVVSPFEKFPSGAMMVGRRKISDTHSYGAISKSSNVGIALIGERVGSKRLYDQLISLGYGQKTGLNLFGESSGMFRKLENWDGYSLHSISFGQEISVTAVQLASAYCVVANGGNLMKPYIVDSFRDETGKIIEQFQPKLIRRVVSQAAADTMKSYLQSVVEEGTAKNIKLNYMSLAGKTGTAQKKAEGALGYAPGKYTGNFIGFFPVEKPQMVVAVVYDEPSGGYYYGGLCAAPTFRRIVEKILFLPSCNILPQNKRMQQISTLTPKLVGMTVSQAEFILRQNGLSCKVSGDDSSNVVIDQYPKPNVSLDKSHPITLVTGKLRTNNPAVTNTGLMPDLKGMTLRKAMQICSLNKINIKINGMGMVRRQSIIAGTKITPGTTCLVDATL